MKKFIIIVSLCFSAPAISAENSVRDILNHNTGTVGDVTINQSNSVSNDQLVSEKKKKKGGSFSSSFHRLLQPWPFGYL